MNRYGAALGIHANYGNVHERTSRSQNPGTKARLKLVSVEDSARDEGAVTRIGGDRTRG